jgi:hypothetical protein
MRRDPLSRCDVPSGHVLVLPPRRTVRLQPRGAPSPSLPHSRVEPAKIRIISVSANNSITPRLHNGNPAQYDDISSGSDPSPVRESMLDAEVWRQWVNAPRSESFHPVILDSCTMDRSARSRQRSVQLARE